MSCLRVISERRLATPEATTAAVLRQPLRELLRQPLREILHRQRLRGHATIACYSSPRSNIGKRIPPRPPPAVGLRSADWSRFPALGRVEGLLPLGRVEGRCPAPGRPDGSWPALGRGRPPCRDQIGPLAREIHPVLDAATIIAVPLSHVRVVVAHADAVPGRCRESFPPRGLTWVGRCRCR